jgi:NADPH:quinone reductase-like Zn-dependent oxidoreductase
LNSPNPQCARPSRRFSVPEERDDVTAAAIPNPGVSAWLSLKHSAKLDAGETVLILGATGVTGKVAVQIDKILGAGRVVAAGRNEHVLSTLHEPILPLPLRVQLLVKRGTFLTRLDKLRSPLL